MKFTNYPAGIKLKELAKSAPDLTKPDVIDAKRVESLVVSSCGWKMAYATERVNEEIQKNLCQLAEEAEVHKKMWDMQNMKVMNYINNFESERRMVGHTAIRNPYPSEKLAPGVHAASTAYQLELEKLRKFLASSKQFKDIIVVGIGGSYLGTLAIHESLKSYQTSDRRLFFASNIDPDKATNILKEVDLKKTLVAIISKSGGTLEIKSQQELLEKRFKEAGLNPKEHFVMVTGKGSPMDKPDHYLEIFYMWDFIGGRYSVSSMVGAVPLAFIHGMEMWTEFLNGLHDMDEHVCREKDPMKNLPLWGALLGIWNRNFLNCSTYAVIPYAQGMAQYSLHLQQLFMESNGKGVCQEDGSYIKWESCPVLWGTVGTEGQHSYFQAIHQGSQVIPIEFIGFKQNQLAGDEIIAGTTNQEKLLSNMFAQSLALAQGEHNPNHNKYFEGNRPSHIMMCEKLDAYALGSLLAYHEHYVAFQGFIWGLNSFDQEGVQLGKLLATNILDLYKEKRQKGSIKKTNDNEAAASFLDLLNHLEPRHKQKHLRSA